MRNLCALRHSCRAAGVHLNEDVILRHRYEWIGSVLAVAPCGVVILAVGLVKNENVSKLDTRRFQFGEYRFELGIDE